MCLNSIALASTMTAAQGVGSNRGPSDPQAGVLTTRPSCFHDSYKLYLCVCLCVCLSVCLPVCLSHFYGLYLAYYESDFDKTY